MFNFGDQIYILRDRIMDYRRTLINVNGLDLIVFPHTRNLYFKRRA